MDRNPRGQTTQRWCGRTIAARHERAQPGRRNIAAFDLVGQEPAREELRDLSMHDFEAALRSHRKEPSA